MAEIEEDGSKDFINALFMNDSYSFSFCLLEKKIPDRWLSKLRIPLLQIQNNLNNRFAFFTSNTPNTFRLDFLWAFSEQF